MKGTLQFQDFRLSTSSPSALARVADNPYKNFAGSKVPQRKGSRIMAEVAYVDYTGKRHTIACKSKGEMIKARKFFDQFRAEHIVMKQVINEFRNEFGEIPKGKKAALRKVLRETFNLQKATADYVIENA